MSSEWVQTHTLLKFRMGELTLFTVRFPCLALNSHFTDLDTDPMRPPPPFERFQTGMEVVLMQSHPIREKLPLLTFLPQAIRYVPSQYQNFYTSLDASFETYLKGMSAKSRSTLQRKVRKFAEMSGGEIDWREFAHPQDMEAFHALGREVSQKTYQERLLDAGLPEDTSFVQRAKELAERGKARGYILFLDKRPISYIFCPVHRKALIYQYVGYDPEFRHLSTGSVLQYLVLEKLMSDGGFSLFDFTEGEGQHKRMFATDSILCANIFYFRPTIRNRMLLWLHVTVAAFSDTAAAFLGKLGVKARIKKLLRAAA